MLQGVKYIVIISTDVSYTCNASTQETISLVRPLAHPPHPTSLPTLLVVNFHSWRRCLTTQTTLTSHSTPLDWQSRQWLVCTSPEPWAKSYRLLKPSHSHTKWALGRWNGYSFWLACAYTLPNFSWSKLVSFQCWLSLNIAHMPTPHSSSSLSRLAGLTGWPTEAAKWISIAQGPRLDQLHSRHCKFYSSSF